jgi:DNA-binding NarL/FixJ family response regulator
MTEAAHSRGSARNGGGLSRVGRLHVLIADHDGLARSMMREALHEIDEVGMVTTAGDGRETLELARYYRPGVLVVETALPPAGAVELIGSVLASTPETRVVTVSVNDDEAALAALRAGAVGHIDKGVAPVELAELVVRAADGEAVVPRRLITRLLELLREVPDAGWRPLRSRLTTREWEIVELIDEDASTQDIAERLVLSPTTVYSHVKSVMRKLGVHSRRDAVAAAERLRREEAVVRKDPGGIAASSPGFPSQAGRADNKRHTRGRGDV